MGGNLNPEAGFLSRVLIQEESGMSSGALTKEQISSFPGCPRTPEDRKREPPSATEQGSSGLMKRN